VCSFLRLTDNVYELWIIKWNEVEKVGRIRKNECISKNIVFF